jgi:hypothetical protein
MDATELWSVLQQQVLAGREDAGYICRRLMSKHDTDYERIAALRAMLDGDANEWLYDILSAPEGRDDLVDAFDVVYQVDWPEMNEAAFKAAAPSVLGGGGALVPRLHRDEADQVQTHDAFHAATHTTHNRRSRGGNPPSVSLEFRGLHRRATRATHCPGGTPL